MTPLPRLLLAAALAMVGLAPPWPPTLLDAQAQQPQATTTQSLRSSPTGEGLDDEAPFTMDFGARIQVRHTQADPPDADRTGSTAIQRGRLSVAGDAYDRFDYQLQLELAGGGVHLIDANVETAPAEAIELWIGQGKAPFGRQQLTSSAELQFVDRTIVDDRFSAGRQQGVAVSGNLGSGLLAYGAGIYDGEGIAHPENENGRYMTVARLVVTPLGPHEPVESAHWEVDGPRLAVGGAALRNTEGTGEDGDPLTRIHRLNAEGAFRWGGFSAVGEVYREWSEPREAPRAVTDGAYLQGGYLLPGGGNELALRAGLIRPEDADHTDHRYELGIAHSYYVREHRAKLQTDLRTIRRRATDNAHRELRIQFQLAVG